jgi:sigma-B regulation protein RsbU (phosphoserine phosphatase)
MEATFLKKIHRSLLRHKTNIIEWVRNGSSSQEICFGEDGEHHCSVESLEIISKIDEALDKVEHGTFGKCELCSGEVEEERLMLDFTTCVCLDHYSPEQLRELERDLEMAAKVQQHLLPSSLPALNGVQMAVLSRPAGAVGGDYYDFFRYKEQCQGFAIADVMGKGVQASMLMANLQASLRIMGPDYPDLTSLANRLNELFRFNLKQIRFITLFLAGYDPDSREMHYINAGHHPPLLWNAASQSYQWLKPTGPAIGLVPETNYSLETLQFDDDDMLVMYTDGLVEARNSAKTEFGLDGLAQYTKENCSKPPQTFLNDLLDEVSSFGGDIRDDLTLMVLKMDSLN